GSSRPGIWNRSSMLRRHGEGWIRSCVVTRSTGAIGHSSARRMQLGLATTEAQALTSPRYQEHVLADGRCQQTLDTFHHGHDELVVNGDAAPADGVAQQDKADVPRRYAGHIEVSSFHDGEAHVPDQVHEL